MKTALQVSLALSVFLSQSSAFAWGSRGHATVCEAAVFLIKDPSLQKFMRSRQVQLAHLCNIPDTLWRDLPKEQTSRGNPTHFMNPENAGLTIDQVPADFDKYLATKEGLTHDNVGSSWWRVDQLAQKATAAAKSLATIPAPKDSKEEQDKTLPYNQAVYEFFTTAAILGHFVGDASMPFHNSADYDGWKTGHGGIHSFFEDTCVDLQSPRLIDLVVREAHKIPQAAADVSVFELVRKVSLVSSPELKNVEERDRVITPSTENPRVKAVRKAPEKACHAFSSIIQSELARSALALAQIWERIYADAGRPDLTHYRSYRYPFQPDFIDPSYVK